jgi:signal transduction histidine kinase
MSDAAAGPLLVGLGATLSLPAVFAIRAHRLSLRLRSLSRPLHELRGALAALELGLTTMERAADKQPELNEWIDALRVPVGRARLGLHDLDHLRAGKLVPAAPVLHSPLDLHAVVAQSVRAWSPIASSYSARLQVDWRAGPVCVRGEIPRLRQALDNLIANALEHGGGRVLIEGELQGRWARVKVSDGGPGAPGSPSSLVDRRRQSARGHGFGIAYDVVRAHGGRLVAGVGRHGPAIVVELPVEGVLGGAKPTTTRISAPPVTPADARSHAPAA